MYELEWIEEREKKRFACTKTITNEKKKRESTTLSPFSIHHFISFLLLSDKTRIV